ncbi:MAG: hypothetical protein AAGA48_39555 [Myxococcota bacterium]
MSEPPGRLAMVFGPPVLDPAAMAEVERHARAFVAVDTPGLLPLRRVDQIKGRVGFGYDVPDGASLAALTQVRPIVPPAVAAEILCQVARTLVDLDSTATAHPGPTKSDVLIDLAGMVSLAGLAGPQPPDADGIESALVLRLGRLLAEMLLGTSWSSEATAPAHEAAIQRLLAKLEGRPGPQLEPAYGQLIRDLLAWEPSHRPSLATVVDISRALAAGPTGEPLERWTRHTWRLLNREPGQDPPRRTGQTDPFVQDPDAVDRPTQPTDETEDVSIDAAIEEDTAVSEHAAPPQPILEQGAIPVGVGPPPEALKPVTLPEGFLEPTHAPAPRPRKNPHETLFMVSVWFVVISGLALVVALVLMAGAA